MKLETLVNKYIRLGYKPVDFVANDSDINSIIDWLWEDYNIFIAINFIPNIIAVTDPNKRFYSRVFFLNRSTESTIVADKPNFKDPYEAKFETLKGLHKVLMFSPEYLVKDEKDAT